MDIVSNPVVRRKCGSFVLVRNGTCMKCDKCGGTTGTSAITRLSYRCSDSSPPSWRPRRSPPSVDRFAVAALDAFLGRLFDGAHRVPTPKPGQVNIPAAAKRACCSAAAVLRLILDKKLKWVGRQPGVEGYMSMLVDVEEVRSLVRDPSHGGFTAIALKDGIQTSDRVTHALMVQGHLKTVTVANPVNRCPTQIVRAEEVERFEREYISLFALARLQGRHFRKLKQELDAAGIEPAPDPEKIGATFYRRSLLTGTRGAEVDSES
jgi:hypothetical protein